MAYPFCLLQGEKLSKAGKGKFCDYHNVSPAKIIEESLSFCSRVFIIHFSEEIIELQDFCQFKTEIDIYPKQYNDKCYISVSLYFCDTDSPEAVDVKVFNCNIIGIRYIRT